MTGERSWAVRRAGIDDLAILIDLEAAAFGQASWGGEGVRAALISPGAEALLASDDRRQPAGFAFWRQAGDEAEILSIGVDPAHRRRGLAMRLLDEIIAAVEGNGAAALFLEVDGGNGAAAALYEKAGFETVGARKAYYRNGADALIMRHSLNTPH